ncbi:MAG: tetratricopeptide repeat protein [Phycisphaeraceae bacterium]
MLSFTVKPASRLLSASALVAVLLGVAAPAFAQDAPVPDVAMTDLEAQVWRDPDFRRRFVESYLAETDLEPKPTSVQEIELINRVLDLMRDEKIGEALKTALDAREADETYSVLIDFLIANLYLNTAMNLAEPGEDATESDAQAYTNERSALLLKSAEYYGNAVVAHPKYRRAWRNLGLVHVRLKQYDEARKAFGKVIMLGGGDPDTYGLMGFCYSALGRHLPAESAYRMANLLDPDNPNWEMELVRSFLLQKRFPEVVALTSKLLEDDPTNERLWLFQANAYIGMDQIDKAAENYEILDGLGKASVDSISLLANIYTNKGIYDTAAAYYERAIDLAEGSDVDALLPKLLRSAKVLSTRGEQARPATKRLVQAIDTAYRETMRGEDRKALLMLQARIAMAEGAGDEQAGILEEVVKLDPLDGEALNLLGQYHFRVFRDRQAESTEPGDPADRAAKAELDQAILYYERAANIEGFEADALVYHAQALVQADRPAEALPLLRKAQQLKPRESVQQYLEAVERMRQ